MISSPAFHMCDLFLDTPAFVAHTTGSDALWAGLPFVTIAGDGGGGGGGDV
jgi:predicted O-linked N-acetylglucosamine transferase (SPINDLY family)